MATLEMAKFGPVTGAWEAAWFNTADSTRQQTGFNRLSVVVSNIQSSNRIGFWCAYGGGDGSVMMIGGGGDAGSRADHGIGITEANQASFLETGQGENDFGYPADASSTQSYSLNLWIR